MVSSSSDKLKITQQEHTVVVTIDNPRSPMNAVDRALHHDLAALFEVLKKEGEARAIVLTGSGRALNAREYSDPIP